MKKNRSIDDLRTYHQHFIKSTEAHVSTMPPYIVGERETLIDIFAEMEDTSKSRLFVGIQKTNDSSQCRSWTKRADDTISRTKLHLRAVAPESVREYFPESNGISRRRIDRLHAVSKILAVSEHFEHAHLGDFKAALEALKVEGETIFGSISTSATEQKTAVKKLKELKQKWEIQHQKLKFLFRGYFYDTSTDWSIFFKKERASKNGSTKDNGAEAALPESTAISLLS